MSEPLVSVVTPAYNYARFLGDAFDSLVAQTLPEWEWLVVDDGSSDDTQQVLAALAARDPRVRFFRQENRGPGAARNRGLQESRGRYLQFLDADDRLLPEKLARHVRFLEEHPETGLVYSEVAYFRSEAPEQLMPSLHGKLSRSIMQRVHGVDEARAKLDHYNIIMTPSALFRRSLLSAEVRFDETAPLGEDYDFWIRLAASGCRFDYLETGGPLAAIRSHSTSTSRSYETMTRGMIVVAKAFARSPLAERWPGRRLPLIYQMMLGIDEADRGSRLAGARRIIRAASQATDGVTKWRWRAYAAAAMALPRRQFIRFVSMPGPEGAFEWYRRVRGLFSK